MRVDSAVVTADGFVLPENVVNLFPNVTYTAPAEGLMSDAMFLDREDCMYRSVVYQTLNGEVIFSNLYGWSLKKTAQEWVNGVRWMHFFRPSAIAQIDSNKLAEIYQRMPWKDHHWFRNTFLRWAELMPAPSEKMPGYVAYYQSTAKRARDIRTPIKPGRFLKKFFSDILNEEQIQHLGFEWEGAFGPIDLKITQDTDEIVQVYQAEHLGSCMWFPHDDYEGHLHPASVYGGNLDLGIAYIGEPAEPKGRCLVWPAKKIFYDKMYGDDFRLRNALHASGWTAGSCVDFDGARLQRFPCKGKFVLPYVDTHERVRDNGGSEQELLEIVR